MNDRRDSLVALSLFAFFSFFYLLPTTSWQVGETISDRYALSVPLGAASGSYSLVVLMYNPQNGQRLPVHPAGGAKGDVVPLAFIQVAPR